MLLMSGTQQQAVERSVGASSRISYSSAVFSAALADVRWPRSGARRQHLCADRDIVLLFVPGYIGDRCRCCRAGYVCFMDRCVIACVVWYFRSEVR